MSWIGDLIHKITGKNAKYAPSLSGFTPIFSQYGDNIYADVTVQQAINCIVGEMKKLQITHVKYNGSDPAPLNDNLQRVLDAPNPLMTQADFIEKTTWLLMLNYNAFIVPTFAIVNGQRVYRALYPIKPTQVDFIEQDGTLYVKFSFVNGYNTVLKYSDIIHLRTHYSVNDYMGGNEAGQPDNRALLETLAVNDSLIKGVARAMNASYAINGVVKYNTMIDDGKTEKALHDLEEKLKRSESGFLPLDLKADFTPIEHKSEIVGEDTLAFFDKKILRHFGVPENILSGSYTTEDYSAFYQKTIEPLVVAFSQAFTKALFNEYELRDGNKVEFYPEDLVFMTQDQVLKMVNLLSATGAMYENEKRRAFGLRPLPELEGKRFISLNWVNADMADEYQLKRAGSGNIVLSTQPQNEDEGVE